MPVMCPNHALQPLYYVIVNAEFHDIEGVLDSGYISVGDVVHNDIDTEELRCQNGCVINPLEIGAHPGLLVDW